MHCALRVQSQACFRRCASAIGCFVDGDIADNLPVRAARRLGADLVVAVDVERGVLRTVERARHMLRGAGRHATEVSNGHPA